MRTIFSLLFGIEVHHSYYAGGRPGSDVAVIPTPETAAMLRERGFVCRRGDDRIAVYAEVTSDEPPELERPAGDPGLRFAFMVLARSPQLGKVTELPELRPGRDVLCFDNLREDIVDGRLHLGDSSAGSRIGSAVRLESRDTLRCDINPPVTATTVEGEDRFGDSAFAADFASPDVAEPLTETVVGEEWERLAPGRYSVFHGGDAASAKSLYRGPGLERRSPLAVIEIYDRTDGFAANGVDLVPAAYRFLTGDQVSPLTYRVRLEPRSTTWKYVVVNKHRPAETDLAALTVTGATTFTRDLHGDRAVFTASARRALRERDESLQLEDASGPLLDLPTPSSRTPLEEGAVENEFVSPIYVYV